MRILFLNRAYPPDVEATGQYLSELAEDLSARHDVHVLCGMPNFGELHGRVFPSRMERSGSVTVWRAWNTRWPKRVPAARMANQASFYTHAALAARRVPRPDVVVSYTDPPFLGLLALRLKRRWGIPFVYYVQDLYPDVLEAIDMAPPVLTAGFRRVQRRLLGGADRIVALGRDMADRIRHKGVPDERISIVHNWADTGAIRPRKRANVFRREHGLEDRFVVMYSGNFGHVWDLDVVLDAAAALHDREDIAFVLIGGGSKRAAIEERVRRDRLGNVRLLSYQPKERLGESLSAADVHVVPMRRSVYGTVVPSKIYGILASGTPMVVLGEDGSEPVRAAREHGCGWCASPGDRGFVIECLDRLSRAPERVRSAGGRARRAAEGRYSRGSQTRRFEALLNGGAIENIRRPAAAARVS